MYYNAKTNEVICSRCEGKAINYGSLFEKVNKYETLRSIESEDYETYICTKCGYKDFQTE